jgi:large subunit ribosomal protein L10
MATEQKRIRPEKLAIQKEVAARLQSGDYVLLVDHSGMTVEQTGDLRQRLRQVQAQFNVTGNTLLARTARRMEWDEAPGAQSGPTAMIVGTGEITETAKILKLFSRESKLAPPKGGWLEGRALSAADVMALADIPSREALLGKMLGTLIALPTQLAGVFQSKVCSLLYVLKAVEDKKGESQ